MTELRHALRVLRNVGLTCGAVVGVLVAVTIAAGALFGVRPVVITSGSMEPAIPTGSVVLSRTVPATDVRVGDVVTVRSPTGSRVTHRVVDVALLDGGGALLRMQGDANDAPDPTSYPTREVGQVVADVPGVGYLLIGLRSPAGLIALGVLTTLLLAIALGGGHRRPGRRGGSHRAGGRRAVTVAAAAGTAVALAAGPASAAAWTDGVAVTGTTFTASTVPAPTLGCGGLGLLSVTFSWTAVPGATGYRLTAGGTTYPLQTTTSRTITTLIAGGTATVVALRDFGSTTWTSVASNSRTYTVALVSLCS